MKTEDKVCEGVRGENLPSVSFDITTPPTRTNLFIIIIIISIPLR